MADAGRTPQEINADILGRLDVAAVTSQILFEFGDTEEERKEHRHKKKLLQDRAARQRFIEKIGRAEFNARKSKWKSNSPDKAKAGRQRYYKKHKENVLERQRKYKESCPDHVKSTKRKSREKTRPKRLQRNRKRYQDDINHRLRVVLRNRLRLSLNGKTKAGSFVRDLGCSIDEFKSYIESKFKPGMTWDNWSKEGWHLDHIKPLASFNLEDREQFLQACHYTNIQPLWAGENLSKGARIA